MTPTAQRYRFIGTPVGTHRKVSGCPGEAGLPADPEFRSAFVAYAERGSRLAVMFSQPGREVTVPEPMPKGDWGNRPP